ncbi:MAG: hypothetical protein IIA62_08805, partial [Nitrospinae bacterium]|nr:hypothetical protein [Nitrospinota bacterium]
VILTALTIHPFFVRLSFVLPKAPPGRPFSSAGPKDIMFVMALEDNQITALALLLSPTLEVPTASRVIDFASLQVVFSPGLMVPAKAAAARQTEAIATIVANANFFIVDPPLPKINQMKPNEVSKFARFY